MFQGHQFIKLLNENWVLDLTEYVGYKVKTNSNQEVESYKQAFQAFVIGDEIVFEKEIRVPVKILKEASSFIRKYEENSGIFEDLCDDK